MGISMREVTATGGDAGKMIDLLHDHVSRLNPSLNLFSAMTSAGGRFVAQLIPLLHTSTAHWQEMKDAVAKAQQGLAAAIPGMDDTHERLVLMQLAVQGFGGRLFNVLKPAIDAVIGAIRRWAESMSESKIRNLLADIGEVSLSVIEVVGRAVITVTESIDKLGKKLDDLKERAASAAGGATGGALGGALLGGLPGAIAGALGGGTLGFLFGGGGGGGGKAPADNSKQQLAAFEATLAGWRAAMARFRLILSGSGSEGGSTGGGINVPAVNAQLQAMVEARRAAIQEQIKLNDEHYKEEIEKAQAAAKMFQISETQKTALINAAIQARVRADEWWLDQEKKIYGLSVKDLQDIENQKKQVNAEANNEMLRNDQAANEQRVAAWKSAADSMASAFNGQLRQLLAGQESFTKAMTNMFAQMIEQMLAKLVTLIAEWLVLDIVSGGSAAAGGGGASFAGLAGKMFGFAGGAWDLPHDMIAQVHKGEMIIPASLAADLRAGMGASATRAAPSSFSSLSHADNRQLSAVFNYQGGALSPATIRQHVRMIANELNAHWATNPTTRPRGF
jgi:hypothetical protein